MACKGLGKCQYLLCFFPSLWPVVSGMNQTDKKYETFIWQRGNANLGNEDLPI